MAVFSAVEAAKCFGLNPYWVSSSEWLAVTCIPPRCIVAYYHEADRKRAGKITEETKRRSGLRETIYRESRERK